MSIIGFDTETTGVEIGSRVVEIAAALVSSTGEVLDQFTTLVNPEMPIPPDVTAEAHHITDAMVVDAPTAAQALLAFYEWIISAGAGTVPLVVHNAPFDCGIISYDGRRTIYPYLGEFDPLPVIDTLAIARDRYGKRGKNSLAALVKKHRIESYGTAHRALPDAVAAARLCLAMQAEAPFDARFTRAWNERVWYRYPTEDLVPDNLRGLPAAVEAATTVTMTYVDNEGVESMRTVTPYGYALADTGEFYFSGHCHLRGARREFRGDRVKAISYN